MKLIRNIFAACALLLASATCPAALLFDTGDSTSQGSLFADSGRAQRIDVTTDTMLTQIGLQIQGTGNGKFVIFGESVDNVLLTVDTTINQDVMDWVYSDSFSFLLEAGKSYYIGLLTDSNITLGFVDPLDISTTQNGITFSMLLANYVGLEEPMFIPSKPGTVNLGMQLYSEQASVPEPSTIVLVAGAMGLVALCHRRRAER